MREFLQAHRYGFAAGALLAFLIAILAPGYLIGSAPEDFSFVDPSWLRTFAGILFVAMGLVFILVYLAIQHFFDCKIGLVVLGVAIAWVCTAGFAIPISKSVEMVPANSSPVSIVGLVIALGATGLLGWLLASGRHFIAIIYLSVQMAVAIVPAIPGIWSAYFASSTDLSDDFEAISPQRSVLVVSFDDLSGRLSREEIESNAELREAFSDFTFFSNTIGNAPGTELSLMHELYGARDFASMGDDLDEGRLKDRLESDTLVLNDPAVDAMAYGSYSIFADSPARKLTIGDLSGGLDPTLALSAINDLYDYIWLRLGTRFAVSLHQKLYQTGVSPLSIITERLRAGCSECSEFSGQLARHQGAQWDRINVNSVKDFDRFTEQVSPSDSQFSIRYIHFLFTHFPVDFDEDCTYRGDDAAWVAANQNEGGAREETRCALKGMVRLLNRLKAQGLYDNTAIIFKSDHGKTNDYAGGTDGKAIFADNPTWGRDRYMPLLMIKSAGAAPGDLEFDDRTAALSDLAATLCPTLPGRRDCSIYPGANLARPAQENAPDIPVFIPRSETSSHRYQDLKVERLERGADLQALSGE